ncbi:MAG: hypothetical protein MHM6MM_006494 [Cercozoa sp. M6MM]
MSCDASRYTDNLVATGGVDRLVRVWDLRNVASPLLELQGHEFAARRVRFSPHNANALASTGYDMSTLVWHLQQPASPLKLRFDDVHTEFIVGAGWSLLDEGVLAVASWDESVSFLQVPNGPQFDALPTPPKRVRPVPKPTKAPPAKPEAKRTGDMTNLSVESSVSPASFNSGFSGQFGTFPNTFGGASTGVFTPALTQQQSITLDSTHAANESSEIDETKATETVEPEGAATGRFLSFVLWPFR